MICPECGADNRASAKFCKNCGAKLIANTANEMNNFSSEASYQNNSSRASSQNGDTKKLILICGTIIICIAMIAAAFIIISNNDNSHDGYYNIGDGLNNTNNAVSDSSSNEDVSTDDVSSSSNQGTTPKGSDIYIKYCDFYTGSAKSDKSYCSANIGTEHTGEKYKISVLYSNDGSNLNDGVSASKTVDEEGFLHIYTSNAFDVYPDKAIVTIYDSHGEFLTEETFYLEETSGQQKFGH